MSNAAKYVQWIGSWDISLTILRHIMRRTNTLLYSDHGASVHARSPYLLSEEQTGAALMARGAGVPALGRVDELTSSVDIYKILGKLAGYPIGAAYLDGNLPEAFGGQRRQYTESFRR